MRDRFDELGRRYRSVLGSSEVRFLFLAGAGISRPSGLPTWNAPARELGSALADGHPFPDESWDACTRLRPEVFLQAVYRGLGDGVFNALRQTA